MVSTSDPLKHLVKDLSTWIPERISTELRDYSLRSINYYFLGSRMDRVEPTPLASQLRTRPPKPPEFDPLARPELSATRV